MTDLRLQDRWRSLLRRARRGGSVDGEAPDAPREEGLPPDDGSASQPGEDHLGERSRERLERVHVALVERLSSWLAWADERGRPLLAPLTGLARRAGSLFRSAAPLTEARPSGPRASAAPPDQPAAAPAHEPEVDSEEIRAARQQRFRQMAEAGIGIGAVVLALAVVGALVVAFGLRTADDGGQELEVGGQPVGSTPVVSKIGITRAAGDLEVTLLRVERMSLGGRVYLRAHNQGAAAAAIPDTEISLRQRMVGTARPAPNRGNRLPRFGSSIQPDEQEFSVLFFPRLRQGGAVVTVPWFTRSTELLPEPVQFSFQVK